MTIRMHWGVAVGVVYTTFAVATLAVVVFAIANPAALVSDDYYQQAMQHDRRMLAIANGRTAGATLTVGSGEGRRTVMLRLAPSTVARAGTVKFYRPSDASLDRALPLAVDASGIQTIDIADLQSGHWRVKVEWEAAGQPYYVEEAVMVAP